MTNIELKFKSQVLMLHAHHFILPSDGIIPGGGWIPHTKALRRNFICSDLCVLNAKRTQDDAGECTCAQCLWIVFSNLHSKGKIEIAKLAPWPNFPTLELNC